MCALIEDQVLVCSVGTQIEPVVSYVSGDHRVLHGMEM